MNRRSFLTSLGIAAVGAAALSLDPEQLLWVPGAKKIVDFGATKHVLPATDAEVIAQARRSFLDTNGKIPAHLARELDRAGLSGPRDITLTIGDTRFSYQGEQLVSLHSENELRLLEKPFFGSNKRYA